MQTTADPTDPGLTPNPLLASHISKPARDEEERRVSHLLISSSAAAADFLLLAGSGLATAHAWVAAPGAFSDHYYLVAVLGTTIAALLAAHRLDLYSVAALRAPVRRLLSVVGAWITALCVLVGSLFLLKIGPEFSRVWLVSWFVAGLASIFGWRAGALHILQSLTAADRLDRRAVIFGAGEAGASLIKRLEADDDNDVRILGVFDDRAGDRVPSSLSGLPVLGNIDQLVAFCRCHRIDMLLLSLPITAERRLLQILKKLWVLPIDIRLAAHSHSLRFRPRTYSHIGSVPLIDVFDRPLAEWDRLVKSVFDRVVTVAALVALSPLMALTALAIKLDSKGPVFFRQKRLGFNNELIEIWKFRSMYTDKADQDASRLVTRRDPRVTPVGRFIRKTSIDELPQLINVLNGTLSLVGPRPHALNAKAADRLYHEVVDGYFARHRVKPGITGLAQIRGWRGETDTEEKIRGRVASDLEYIENWSLLLDLYILASTPLALARGENAY